jgi:hypothetical protein
MHATCPPRTRLGALTLLVALLLGLVALGAPGAHAQAAADRLDQTQEITDFPVPVGTCVNGGAGEVILVSGTVHAFTSLRTDGRGGFHATVHTNLAGAAGVGTSSGDTYRVNDTAGGFGTRGGAYFPPDSPSPRQLTESSDVRIISTGSGANFVIQRNFHVTFDANGVMTGGHSTFEERCVG